MILLRTKVDGCCIQYNDCISNCLRQSNSLPFSKLMNLGMVYPTLSKASPDPSTFCHAWFSLRDRAKNKTFVLSILFEGMVTHRADSPPPQKKTNPIHYRNVQVICFEYKSNEDILLIHDA